MYLPSPDSDRRSEEPASGSSTIFAHEPPGVAYGTFLGIIWAGTCLSFIFLGLRLVSRFRAESRQLFLDDGLTIFAWILILVTAALWQWNASDMYYILDISSGLTAPDADFFPRLVIFARVQFAVELLFYTALFAIKLSFLSFFRRLGERVRGHQYIWWLALVISVVTYAVSLGDGLYTCELGSAQTLVTYCNSVSATNFTVATLKANCALDVFSDLLIMLIPITLLWNVRIPLAKKAVFIGLFSLTLITIVIAIVRAVSISATRQGTGHADTTSLWLWSAVQAPLAVVISCLSAFPQLFNRGKERQTPKNTPTDAYYERVRSRMKTIAKQTSTPHTLCSVIQIPAQSLPGYRSSGSLTREHTRYAASYDSLEMPPESSEQIQQHPNLERGI